MFRNTFTILILTLILTHCSSSTYTLETIRIKGSDTMLILTELLAEEYMSQNPGIAIYVEGGGTTSGVDALLKDKADICTASRNLRADEAKALADYYGTLGFVYLVAKDALCIYVNPNNKVKNLSIDQLKAIFTNKVNNWKSYGGKDINITPVVRTPNSGTYYYFKEHVLEGEKYYENVVFKSTTEEVLEAVLDIEGAIGYGGIGYQEEDVLVSINGVYPTADSARNDTYPITRYLNFFTSRTASGAVKDFIDWVISPAGQAVVKKANYIPLWEITF
jgi:phosphate transport system substrate-binding protein